MQDCDDHEIVVVNDGSTDSTGGILERYKTRTKVFSVPNGGPSKARNTGIANSSGRYVAFLDADDLWLPRKLKTMVAALQENPLASLAFSECRFIDKDGNECGQSSLGHAPSMDELLIPRPLPILTSTWVLPRVTLEKIGGFNEKFRGPGLEDTWVLLLLRELGEFAYIPDCLTLYSQVDSGVTADKYDPGTRMFVSLVSERYGARGRRWIHSTKNSYCRAMLSKIAHQMNRNDRLGAVRTLTKILWFRPGYLLGTEFRRRLFLSQNIRRLRALTAVRSGLR